MSAVYYGPYVYGRDYRNRFKNSLPKGFELIEDSADWLKAEDAKGNIYLVNGEERELEKITFKNDEYNLSGKVIKLKSL